MLRHRIAGLGGVLAVVEADADDFLRIGHARAERAPCRSATKWLSLRPSAWRPKRLGLRGGRFGGFCRAFRQFGALLGRFFGAGQIERRVDQRDVREGLRKIAEQALGARVVFFARAARRRCRGRPAARTGARRRRAGRAADTRRRARSCRAGTRLRRPAGRPARGACRSAARARRRAGPARSPRRCRDSAGRRGLRKPIGASSSRLASRSLRAIDRMKLLRSASQPWAQTSSWISVAQFAPVLDRARQAEHLGALDRAIERHPGHHLRIGEVHAARCAPPRCRGRARARFLRGDRAARSARPRRTCSRRPPRRPWCSVSITSPNTSS